MEDLCSGWREGSHDRGSRRDSQPVSWRGSTGKLGSVSVWIYGAMRTTILPESTSRSGSRQRWRLAYRITSGRLRKSPFWDNSEVIWLTNILFIALGLFFMTGAFLATGGRGEHLLAFTSQACFNSWTGDSFHRRIAHIGYCDYATTFKLRHYQNSKCITTES